LKLTSDIYIPRDSNNVYASSANPQLKFDITPTSFYVKNDQRKSGFDKGNIRQAVIDNEYLKNIRMKEAQGSAQADFNSVESNANVLNQAFVKPKPYFSSINGIKANLNLQLNDLGSPISVFHGQAFPTLASNCSSSSQMKDLDKFNKMLDEMASMVLPSPTPEQSRRNSVIARRGQRKSSFYDQTNVYEESYIDPIVPLPPKASNGIISKRFEEDKDLEDQILQECNDYEL